MREPNLLVWLATVTQRLEIPPLRPDDLQTVENQEVFKSLRRYMSGDEQWDPELFQDALTPHLHGHLAKLISYGAQLPQCTLGELRLDSIQTLLYLRLQQLQSEAHHLKFMQDDAVRQGDMHGAKQLAEVNNQQIRELFHLQQSKHSLTRLLAQSGEFRPVA